jgi:hypothetical protein
MCKIYLPINYHMHSEMARDNLALLSTNFPAAIMFPFYAVQKSDAHKGCIFYEFLLPTDISDPNII